jgi:LPS export ABC transporter permease LptF
MIGRRWLIERYIAAAILPYLLIALLLLTAILFAQQVGRFAEILGATRAPLDIVFEIALGLTPNVLIFTVPLATLAGTVIGFSRMNSDSEVVATRASGVGPWQMLAPALLIGTVLTACTLYIGIKMVPGAARSLREVAVRAALIKLQSPVELRSFNTEIPGKIIFVHEGDEASNLWRGVFILAEEKDKKVLVTARTGRIDSSNEQAELVLSDGQAITLSSSTLSSSAAGNGGESRSVTIDRFEQSRIKLDTGSNTLLEQWRRREPLADELDWESLMARAADTNGSDKKRAATLALHKKLALCTAPLAFAFLGASLGMRVRRGGRGAGTLWSVLVMLCYYLTLLAGEQMARTTTSLPVWSGEWLANGLVMFLGILLLLYERNSNAGRNWLSSYPTRKVRKENVKDGEGTKWGNRRLPALSGLLNRGVMRSLSLNFIAIYIAMVGIFLIFTVFELWRSIVANNVRLSVVINYLFYLVPYVSVSLAPICLLVAVLATYAVMARRSEAVAWWASGQSVYRLAVPGIVFACVVSAGMWLVQERALADFNRRQDMLRIQIKGEAINLVTPTGRRWLESANGTRIYSYEYDETAGEKLIKPDIYLLDTSKVHIEQLISGQTADWSKAGKLTVREARVLDLTKSRSFAAFDEYQELEIAGSDAIKQTRQCR